MNKLNNAVAQWDDYERLESGLKQRGFGLHHDYRQAIIEIGNISHPTSLDRYWREYAREYVTSLNSVESNTRTFNGALTYRSTLLDDYASSLPYNDQPTFSLPLLPSLRSLQKRLDTGESLATQQLEAKMNLAIKEEAERFSTSISLDKFDDTSRLLTSIGRNLGGSVSKNKVVFMSSRVSISVSRHRSKALEDRGIIQFDSWLGISARDKDQFLVNWDSIMPGFGYYKIFVSKEDRIRCISAHLTLAKLFVEIIEK